VEFQSCRLECSEFRVSRLGCVRLRGDARHSRAVSLGFRKAALLLVSVAFLAAFNCPAVTLEQLRQDPDLTPERLISYFRDFKFKLGEKVQSPEMFLASQSGDCDDFASLASEILRERKYTTRLIAVFMDGQTHVVCYVEEIKGYLDYNHRNERSAIQATTGDLEDVANKVATFFRLPWRCASEFTYHAGDRRIGRIVFR